MLIKTIELSNFRQYKGDQVIDCSILTDKPITAVLGENTSGKSTAIRAITWCLYGGNAEELGFKKNSPLLNDTLLKELEDSNPQNHVTKTVKVKLEVEKPAVKDPEHPENYSTTRQYTFERSIKYEKIGPKKNDISQKEKFSVYSRVGEENPREVLRQSEKKRIVNSFMPKELSECFFFWGERFDAVSKRGKVNEAVDRFTGVDIYTKAIDHLKSVWNEFNRIYHNSKSDKSTDALEAERQKLEDSIMQLDEKIESTEESLLELKDDWTSVHDQFLRVRDKYEDGERRKKLEASIKSLEEQLGKKEGKFKEQFNNLDFPKYIVLNKAETLVAEIDKNESSTIGWGSVTVDAIREILEKGICVCGAKLSDHPDLIEHLEKQKALAVPNALGNYLAGMKAQMKIYNSHKLSGLKNLQSTLTDIKEINEDLFDERTQVIELDTAAETYKDAAKLKEKYEYLQRQMDEKRTMLGGWKTQKEGTEERLAKIKKSIKKQMDLDEKNRVIKAKIDMTDQVIDKLRAEKKQQSQDVKKRIIQLCQEYLNYIYSGERIVDIDGNYNIKLFYKGPDGKPRDLDTSSGLDSVINFGFVAALITVAREVLQKQKPGEEVQYPLVLDAPFSQTDKNHTFHICEILSKITEQTIFFMMQRDWEIASSVIEERVGDKYMIQKQSETLSLLVKEEVSEQ